MIAAPTFRRRPRATCPACGRSAQLDSHGRLHRHPEAANPYATVRLASRPCPGTGYTPEEPAR